ncbi:MAG: putative patatin-like phospholipase [Ignavibacteriae bacterium]|nr:MAG: putative patatin-like phospholipase [Ignavibacteriota bacterium]
MKKLLYLFLIVFFSCPLHSQNKYIINADKYNLDFENIYKKNLNKKPKIGLVLSGGGARGFAQIGVLKVFEKYNIIPDLIVGNSIGAIIGGLYSSGYSATQLESIAVNTNWDDLLSLRDETKRTDLFVDQKQARERGFLLIRFAGLNPIIPSSISSGQEVLNFLNNLTLQALYHPFTSFDELKIPFRAVAADVSTGKRYIFDRGSLAEALRASSGIPLLFTPVEKDSASLIDGGIISNIPVDVAKKEKCDIIIVVNSTSEINKLPENAAPWEIADQLMTIMMQQPNAYQLSLADVVIKPDVNNHLASDFSKIEALIKAGEKSALEKVNFIMSLISEINNKETSAPDSLLQFSRINFLGDSISTELKNSILNSISSNTTSISKLKHLINNIYSGGDFEDIYVELSDTILNFHFKLYPIIRNVKITGNFVVQTSEIENIVYTLVDHKFNVNKVVDVTEDIISIYRKRGYSLARVKSVKLDPSVRELLIEIDEGIINTVRFEGNHRTAEYVVRREFPLRKGDVFQIHKAQKGISNIKSLGLFEYVLLEIQSDEKSNPNIVVRMKERSTDILRLGLGANNERGFIMNVELRDANFRGHGEELGLSAFAGNRDKGAILDYRIRRIFNTYFTLNLMGYYRTHNIYTYKNEVSTSERYWKRVQDGEYRLIRYGGLLGFGTQMERLGNIMIEYRYEQQEIRKLIEGGYFPEKYPIAILKIGSIIDTKNSANFPTSGMFLSIMYENGIKSLGSNISFTKLSISYENYLTVFFQHTLGIKINFGAADATLPLAEQFSIGGLNSFFGLRQYDSRGRQTLQLGGEYRMRLPFSIIYPTFASFKYNLGMISSIPQELKLIDMRHGFGFQIGIDSPIGAVNAAVGRSFFLPKKVKTPPSVGPWLFYFSIGYDIDY